MSKIGFPEKVLGKTKICDFRFLKKWSKIAFLKKRANFCALFHPEGKAKTS